MAAPTQSLNQFGMKQLKGEVSMVPSPATISVQLTPAAGNSVYAGDAVKLIAGTSKQILVDLAAVADIPIGIVIRAQKTTVYTAGQSLEIALPGSVIVVEAYGVINRGQALEWYSPTSAKQFKAAAGVYPTFGVALDSSSATGDLIRMLVRAGEEYSSSSSSSSCRSSSSSSSSV